MPAHCSAQPTRLRTRGLLSLPFAVTRSYELPGGTIVLLPCAKQMIVRRTAGVVDKQHSSAVLFAAVKGAHDMSLKSFILRLLLCTSALPCAVPVMHTHLFPIAEGGMEMEPPGPASPRPQRGLHRRMSQTPPPPPNCYAIGSVSPAVDSACPGHGERVRGDRWCVTDERQCVAGHSASLAIDGAPFPMDSEFTVRPRPLTERPRPLILRPGQCVR